jgi:6-pyruvoyltetrahydropterin/6-carboxytetrahydropterin synthase
MGKFYSTKVIELGSTAFRQPGAKSHCSKVHGYQLKAKLWFSADVLNECNWVFDFSDLKELKENLQKTFDHKLVISKDDPAKSAFKELERYGAVDLVVFENGVGIERFAEYVFNAADSYVKYKTSGRVWCERVEVFEHELNSAIYEKDNITNKLSILQQEPENTLKLLNEVDPVPVAAQAQQPAHQENKYAAPVGNRVTSGWSNPFGGTSWGA